MNKATPMDDRRRLRDSVFVRCAALMALTTVTVAGFLWVTAAGTATRLALDTVKEKANQITALDSAALVDPLRFGAVPKVAETAEGALDAAGAAGRGTLVIDADGSIVAQTGEPSAVFADLQDLAARAVREGAATHSADGLLVAHPVQTQEGGVHGAIALGMDGEAARASVSGVKRDMLLWSLAIFVVMMSVTILLLRRLIGTPMREIGIAVARVADGDYDTDPGLRHRRDEIGGIACNLAALVDRLAEGRAAEEARIAYVEAQSRVVDHLGQGLDALAQGILTAEMEERFPEEYEALRVNYKRAVESLNAAIGDVNESAVSIRSGADEIARASDDLSRRTENQAATLEQTAAALDQLLGGVRSAADGAAGVDRAVRETRDMASRNGEVMDSAVRAVAAIETSSEKIGDIITVIDDIAFQTNLLALNAGVEAARAGSSGKGFAVVASEVRALAQRSSDAAQQIKDLILGSTEQVKEGVQLVERAGDALGDVVTRVGEISDLVSGIAKGAEEQAQGLDEINEGVANLDRVTQQNAAMVEQSTAAAHQLKTQAETLSALVTRFHLADASSSRDGAQLRGAA